MKASMAFVAVFLAISCPAVQALKQESRVNPIEKILTMLSDLEAKVSGEGAEAKKTYEETMESCGDRSKQLAFEIKTGKAEVADLTAAIAKEEATGTALTSKIEEFAASISSDEADLEKAKGVRAEEAADFAAMEKETTEIMGTLTRAIGILEKEMAGGASMMQLQNTDTVAQAFTVMVQASALSSADAAKLTALVQDGDEDSETGAPAGEVYVSKSGGIVSTLTALLDKAQEQLATAQKDETVKIQNFQLLSQSLEDSIKHTEEDLSATKKSIASSAEIKASTEGDLSVTSKDLEEDTKALATTKSACMTAAEDYEASSASRAEELEALSKAKSVLAEATGGAESITYSMSQVSFLQVQRSRLTTGADLANFEAVHFVRDLARKHHSPELVQLALRMAHAMHMGGRQGQDPFSKVKGLIMDMIEKLSEDAQADASQKAYCDKETGETQTTMEEKSSSIEKLTTKIDVATAATSKLKSEVATLEKELAELAKSQAEMTATRQEEHATFVEDKAAMEAGVEGVKQALKVLKDYYASDGKAHSAATAGEGIISLLEVCESDFTKGLSQMIAIEETSASTYETTTKENDITKVTKEQSVKYKTKESAKLDKDIAELSSDRSGEKAELAAKTEYLGKLMKMCIAQPETYTERKSRREAEIAGLKQAMAILDGESMLLQRAASRRALRR
mmetsp:Transcript_155064/g.273905  ORF Transcript_155064/g.273905 Transcript_155064/m.273905 type:complete len:684 (+) Transcript_155064:69-2120(+)